MNWRKTSIARMAFASPGTELDDTAWNVRKNSLMNRLKIQLPALRDLTSSFISTTTELSDNQLQLVIYLEESPQTQLRNLSGTQADRDSYLQDIRRVREQQGNLHERFQQAIKSIEHPAELLELQELRSLLWQSRADGRIQLHSSLHGEWMRIPHLQTTLSQSVRTKIVIKVLRINRHEIGVALSKALICPVSQRRLFDVDRKISLKRPPKLRHTKSSVQLAKMMHEPSGQEVPIEIEYSWVDGSPHRLTLLGTDAQ